MPGEPEVLWVSKDGRTRAVVSPVGYCVFESPDDAQHWTRWYRGMDNLPTEFHEFIIALCRERALGAKCEKIGMGRP